MLPNVTDENILDVATFFEQPETLLSRLGIKYQQCTNAPPFGRRGQSEKLLRRFFSPYKVIRRLDELDCEVVPGEATGSERCPT